MPNVLILGSGTQSLAILRGLKESGHNVFMLADEQGNYADRSKYLDKVIYDSTSPHDASFYQIVESLLKKYSIDVLIPVGDPVAEFVSMNKERLSSLVSFRIPDYEYFRQGYDKGSLMTLCEEKGYPHPYNLSFSEVDYENPNCFETFPFPAILKPNITTGGRGMVIVEDYAHLKAVYPVVKEHYGPCHLQRYIKPGGRQIKVQLYVSRDGAIRYTSVLDKTRWYPIDGGSSCCSVSISRDIKEVGVCEAILRDLHWEGFADFDLIEDGRSGDFLIMEINPRLPACLGASVHSGVNWGALMVADSLGLPLPEELYEAGHVLRHFGFDLLWFLASPNRFHTTPSWFRFWGKNIHYQDFMLSDQRPFWSGTWHNIKKLFDPNFRSAKRKRS